MTQQYSFDDIVADVQDDLSLDEAAKRQLLLKLGRLKNTRVNILITGATGSGKSSTINALFNVEHARVGQGVDPETLDIARYEFNNIVLFDSPGLGDGKERDQAHAHNIIAKLREQDADGGMLIDLVLVILEGGSKDLGTSFELINKVIIPNLNGETDRLLVAINQADVAMKGRYWNKQDNRPEPELVRFLEEKVVSTQKRILEATGVSITTPIYYCAGYKDGTQAQNPYNLSKLLLLILRHTRQEKRAAFLPGINTDRQHWQDDDRRENYRAEIEKSVWESIVEDAEVGAKAGERIGGLLLGEAGRTVGRIGGALVSGTVSVARRVVGSIFDSIFG